MANIGNVSRYANAVLDVFTSGVNFTAGTTTTLTLSGSPGSQAALLITFDGVVQQRDQWTVAGKTVTFIAPIPYGVTRIECEYKVATSGVVPNDGAVTTVKIADANITPVKLSSGAPSWDTNGNLTIAGNIKSGAVAFSAYQSVNQSMPNATITKVQLQSKEFDTANAFDAVTNYRFTAPVAGYYQLNGCVIVHSIFMVYIYKNGVEYTRGSGQTGTVNSACNVSTLMYLNGTTDYVELWGYQNSGSTQLVSASASLPRYTYFNGILLKAV